MILSFMAAVGVTLVILACALANYNWWPIFVIVFYILSPIPFAISRRCGSDGYLGDNYNGRCFELSLFLTSIIVISAYALPVVLAHAPIHAPIIQWGSAAFVFAGNTVIFLTIGIFVRLIVNEESYSSW